MTAAFKPNQKPFPVVFVKTMSVSPTSGKTQMGLLHVNSLAELPNAEDRVFLPRKDSRRPDELFVLRRQIHYKPAEANEPAVIDFVEVVVQ